MVFTESQKLKGIKDTQRACEKAMEAVVSYLQTVEAPISEEAHELIDKVLTENDCESPEGHIVASGKQSANPHELGTGMIEREVPIVIDIYPRSKTTGYFADMSRTVYLGKPSVELQKMFDIVHAAQELAISMIEPRAKCLDIQNVVENHFIENGYITSGKGDHFPFAQGFVHGIGHGVGLKLHDSPRIGRNTADTLKEGDVVTVEPGLYYPNIGGVRLEDLILVTRDGAENLTNFTKKLEI